MGADTSFESAGCRGAQRGCAGIHSIEPSWRSAERAPGGSVFLVFPIVGGLIAGFAHRALFERTAL
jgi:hypothetical protein